MFENPVVSEIVTAIFIGQASVILTLVIFHFIASPKVKFSKAIRVVSLKNEQRSSYSIKIRKTGITSLVDTRIHCRIGIHDILHNGGSLWNYYDIPTTFSDSLLFVNSTRVVHFNLAEIDWGGPKSLPLSSPRLKIGRSEPNLRLEDIYLAFPKVQIQIFLLGHDRFTGTKKIYVSQRYWFHNICRGKWKRFSTELIPYF